jgi:hypothetical protein
MKSYGEVNVQIHILLTSAPVEGEWPASRPCRFTPGERAPGTHWIGGWVDLRVGLDDVEKRKFLTLPGLDFRPLGRLFPTSQCPSKEAMLSSPVLAIQSDRLTISNSMYSAERAGLVFGTRWLHVFPVSYELNFYIRVSFGRNSVLEVF